MAPDDTVVRNESPQKGQVREHRAQIWWYFGSATVALFVAAIILPPVLHSGEMFWPLTLIGAFVITALMSAAAVPHLRHHH